MARKRKGLSITGLALLIVFMVSGCSFLLNDDTNTLEDDGQYIKLIIDRPPTSKAITVNEYDVTGMTIVVHDPDGEVIQIIDWEAEDGPMSYLIPVQQQGEHKIFVTHIGEQNGEVVEVTESATFNIQAMVITVIEVIPGSIGLINIEGINPPTAVFTANPTSGSAPLTVSFDASGSSDPDAGDTLSFSWDFGDGTSGDGVAPSHTYDSEGIYVVTLTVQDSIGSTDTAVTTITVTSPVPIGSIVNWGVSAWGWVDRHSNSNAPSGKDYVVISGGYSCSLALKSDGSIVAWGHARGPVPLGNDFMAIATHFNHSLALKSDGSIVAWGNNIFGQCDVPSGHDYAAISAGHNYSLALKSDGSIVAWGSNRHGQCDVPSGHDYVAISAGGNHGLALKSDGSIVAWGNNNFGQCDIPSGHDYVAIAAGQNHSLALKSDGSLITWGGSDPNIWSREPTPSGNDYVAITAGWSHNLALKSDGSIVGWGWNGYGQCNVPSGNDYVAIAAGGYHSVALRK